MCVFGSEELGNAFDGRSLVINEQEHFTRGFGSGYPGFWLGFLRIQGLTLEVLNSRH